MKTTSAVLDQYIFDKQFEAFKNFVEEESKVSLVSFVQNPYTFNQEGYKSEIHKEARDKLAFQAWKKSDIGSGDIILSVIESIEFQNNNLVSWQSRYGDEQRPHQILYKSKGNAIKTKSIEKVLFRLYHENNPIDSFNELIDVFGKKYSLIAYLYFIKDHSQYLPIAPKYFDRSFELLGVSFKTKQRCSWDNYSQYLNLIRGLMIMLTEAMSTDVSLLDAHSFAWMLSAQMESKEKVADLKEYLSLSDTERDTIIKSRIGQGQFRQSLINYWKFCAITSCTELKLLKASHIKPWAKSSVTERLSLYNGILLSPTLDACFDSGFISFDNIGKILISKALSEKDMVTLSINKEMQLSKIEPGHNKYLEYHRNNIFKAS